MFVNKFLIFFLCISGVAVNANQLPELGDAASAYISLAQEQKIGQKWLQQKRQNAAIIEQPFITEYFENLMYRLLPHANLPQKQLEFVVFDDASLNASAVPGGIITINLGLFLYTQDEDEFASIMAHEFAHLGQRHFARHVQAMEKQEPIALAGILAGILLMASNNTKAGMAAVFSSPAIGAQNYLTYSRAFEREADRIGMQTLVKAGMDPYAMPAMFKAMLQSYRYSPKAPEFLQTHPLSNNRMADAANRAENFKAQKRSKSFEFLIIQNFAKIKYQYSIAAAQSHFLALSKHKNTSKKVKSAALYSLAMLAFKQKKHSQALTYLKAIEAQFKRNTAVITLTARVLFAQKKQQQSLTLLHQELKNRPDDAQIMFYLSEQYRQANNAPKAIYYLKRLLKQNNKPHLWSSLSQAYQNNKQPMDSLRALAEYSYLTGRYNNALKQLQQALEMSKKHDDFQTKASIENRIIEINAQYAEK